MGTGRPVSRLSRRAEGSDAEGAGGCQVAMTRNPGFFIMTIVGILICSTTYLVRLAEGPAQQPHSKYVWNQMWVTFTQATTGYGESVRAALPPLPTRPCRAPRTPGAAYAETCELDAGARPREVSDQACTYDRCNPCATGARDTCGARRRRRAHALHAHHHRLHHGQYHQVPQPHARRDHPHARSCDPCAPWPLSPRTRPAGYLASSPSPTPEQ
jgi:hypothetical protein